MATYRAIEAASSAIASLLDDTFVARRLLRRRAGVRRHRRQRLRRRAAERGGVFVYRIEVNGTRRHPSGRVDPGGRRDLPKLPVDVHLLVVVSAADAEHQAGADRLDHAQARGPPGAAARPAQPRGRRRARSSATTRPSRSRVDDVSHEELLHLWEVLGAAKFDVVLLPYVLPNLLHRVDASASPRPRPCRSGWRGSATWRRWARDDHAPRPGPDSTAARSTSSKRSSRSAPLGLRFWDWALDQPVREGLVVRARPAAGGPVTTARPSSSGVHGFLSLPTTRDGRAGTDRRLRRPRRRTPSPSSTPRGRYVPMGLTVDAPVAGVQPPGAACDGLRTSGLLSPRRPARARRVSSASGSTCATRPARSSARTASSPRRRTPWSALETDDEIWYGVGRRARPRPGAGARTGLRRTQRR